jgi:hypothetical protein
MPLTSQLKASYEAVMSDLVAERQSVQDQLAALAARMRELNNSIGTLSKRLQPETSSSPSSSPAHPNSQKYAHMSVRWAILDTLVDSGPLSTADIADALKASGIATKAANFANNVSAVLSNTLKERHDEVLQLSDGRWQLNENGKQAIAHIRTTPKFRGAIMRKAA